MHAADVEAFSSCSMCGIIRVFSAAAFRHLQTMRLASNQLIDTTVDIHLVD
jgi:hypothetical protein